jgi:hypothetical protein
MLPARAVAAVDPFNKVLYLEPRRARTGHSTLTRTRRRLVTLREVASPYAHSLARAGVAGARRSGALTAAGLRIAGRYGKDGVVWLSPRLQAGARTTALFARKRYSEAALWLAPRLATGLRAVAANADALVLAARRRRSR